MPTLLDRIRSAIAPLRGPLAGFSGQAPAQALAVSETDNTFYPGNGLSSLYRDRFDYDRRTIYSECLRAWRVNPLARHIVKLTTAFVIGNGLTPSSPHRATNQFLTEWWNHPLNKLGHNSKRFSDELLRAGNLFFLITTAPDGMTFVRAIPAESIAEIQTADNDIEQETYYLLADPDKTTYPAFDPNADQAHAMIHYAVNRPVGTCWGEPDLGPLLPWIGRFSSWLEDRARLNRFRNTFLWVVRRRWESEAQKAARQTELNAHPPTPGSILLADQDEEWAAPAPNLNSSDAHSDGLDLKKMIAAGSGLPLHYLAEPESSTRTTADAAGTPTFRRLEDIQLDFVAIIADLAALAVATRKRADRRVSTTAQIQILKPDITERDNAVIALAGQRIYPAIADLFDREAIPQAEMTRLFYRMVAEIPPANLPPAGAKRKPLESTPIPEPGATPEPDETPTEDPQP